MLHSVKKFVFVVGVIGISFISINTFAHERYILPSHTMLSGNEAQFVTLTASISNDIFHPDRPYGNHDKRIDVGQLAKLFDALIPTFITPNGETINNVSWQAFKRMSVADVEVEQSGTYRIGLVQPDIAMTTFKKADGTSDRIFGKQPKLPANVTDVVRRTTSARVETFVSVNDFTDTAINTRSSGLELGGETHPNDLFSGEAASFQLFFDGKPIKDINPKNKIKVHVVKAGTRHRNVREEVNLPVDAQGHFTFTPTAAGFYLLIVEKSQKISQPVDVDVKHHSLYATLEVFPE